MDTGSSWADQVMAEDQDKLGPQVDSPDPFQQGFTLVQKRKPKRVPQTNQRKVVHPIAPAKAREQQAREKKPTTQIVLDPRPLPPPLIGLYRDSNAIYQLVREHHPYGGITARKIYKILDDQHYISDLTGDIMSLQNIGDILYDELKIKKIVYPVGEKGPKWRLLL